jgi:hypothetical protein
MMCEVLLGRVKEFLFGVAGELRPTLAVGDPARLFVDRSHVSSNKAAAVRSTPVTASQVVPLWSPVTTPGKGAAWTLAIRFQNVAHPQG